MKHVDIVNRRVDIVNRRVDVVALGPPYDPIATVPYRGRTVSWRRRCHGNITSVKMAMTEQPAYPTPMAEPMAILEDKEQRLDRRRKRVAAKIEENRRQAQGIKPPSPVKQKIDPERARTTYKQTIKSKERLEKLVTDGTQLVTNVAVAVDAREVKRRQEDDEGRKARYDKLEAEANAGEERFQEIVRKWNQSSAKCVPQELQHVMQQQKEACNEMFQEKEKLIAEFQEELKGKDEQYVKLLKTQAEDVDLLVERMEEQAKSAVKAFREELEQIDKTFTLERQDLLLSQNEEYMKMKVDKEKEYMRKREERLDENEVKLRHLRIRNAEELNQKKISLEMDIQILQQQIQQMKATFQLNAEKLEYNFQVLKKRDEENTVTISQQKRKITRLQDILNVLKGKLVKQEKAFKTELEALLYEYRKSVDQYRELQKKVQHFQLIDAKRFYDIWKMSEEKVRKVAEAICCVDQVIYKQQLGLNWSAPPPVDSPLQPLFTKMEHVSQATMYVSQFLSDTGEESEKPTAVNGHILGLTTSADRTILPSLIKEVLALVAKESSFLIEPKLSRLLAPLQKEEQMLMKLDSIFKALEIETESDVHKLVKFFIKETPSKVDSTDSLHRVSGETSAMTAESSMQPPLSSYLIHPNEVPNALRGFTESRQGKSDSSFASSRAKILGLHSEGIAPELLNGSFWHKMSVILEPGHRRVWIALSDGLEKYYSVLSARVKLTEERDATKQQNTELRLLLHQYMHSKVNQELEVPPTLAMPANTIERTVV